MQIEVTTDNHITGSNGLNQHVRSTIEGAMERFGDRVTWVEVHLGDENSHKAGGAWCGIHAKLAGIDTVNVNADSGTIDQALDAATDKLLKVIDRTLGKKEDPKKRAPMHGEPGL
jgi:ribosome-associated translation inhibitor RaiA